MKTILKYFSLNMLIFILSMQPFFLMAEKTIKTDTISYNEYRGKIVDAKSNKLLAFASIKVGKTNMSSISNSKGEFVLRIPKNSVENIFVSYMGYKNKQIAIENLRKKNTKIKLVSDVLRIDEIKVMPNKPLEIIKKVMLNKNKNYSTEANMMRGFYREVIKKNRHFVALSEAVVDINKMPYSDLRDDRVELFKSRSAKNLKKMDTLFFKLQGGPAVAMLLDIVKNPYNILSEEIIPFYNYEVINIIKNNGALNYVIEFKQKESVKIPLYYGVLYVNTNTYALNSARFSLNIDDKEQVARMFVKKKPAGVKISPAKLDYIVNYSEDNGKWYFNYVRGEMVFKCKWKKRLFRSKFSIITELAMTDRNNKKFIKIKNNSKFKKRYSMQEQISKFADNNFWGNNNVIEPEKSINSVIKKLKNKTSL